MHGNLPAQAQRSIFAADSSAIEKSISDSLVIDPENKWFSALCEKLWRDKPAAALDHLTSAEIHQCYRYASGRQGTPGKLIVELLLGDDGPRVLDALLKGSKSRLAREWQRGRVAIQQLDQWKQLDLGIE